MSADTIDYAREEGEARGIAIGEELGVAKRNVQIATAMLAKGMDIELICELTGLTSEEVNALN